MRIAGAIILIVLRHLLLRTPRLRLAANFRLHADHRRANLFNQTGEVRQITDQFGGWGLRYGRGLRIGRILATACTHSRHCQCDNQQQWAQTNQLICRHRQTLLVHEDRGTLKRMGKRPDQAGDASRLQRSLSRGVRF